MNNERFRELLLDERRRVSDAIAYLHAENAGSQDDEVPETGDADTATVTLDRELDYSLEENSTRVLDEIESALRRIEDGTFGACERCGNTIARRAPRGDALCDEVHRLQAAGGARLKRSPSLH